MTKIVSIQGQQKWEYCTETRYTDIPFLAALNERGQQGWEVVHIVHHKEPKGGNMAWTAFFKRPSAGPSPTAPLADSQTSTSPTPASTAPMGEHHSSQPRAATADDEGYQVSKG